MSGLVHAARYLTILPLPGRRHAPPDELGRAAPWFPVVGGGLGLALVAADLLAARLFSSLLAALLVVTVWKLLTGGLHLDGLADCLDGLGGRNPDHRRVIMRDSRIGTFGAVGLILFLMLEIVAVAELPPGQRWRVLLAAPAIARAAPPLLARLLRPAGGHGQGAAFAAGVGPGSGLLALALAALIALGALGVMGVVAAAAGLAAAAAAARFVGGRVGGLTGDVFGAAVEVAELTVLLAVIAWAGARA
ncbi:MAG TPA: adenosylcobinamide-GDP ribazoletransferase [Methylomirabilota bacterium]|nr:adenosylcobinamide-GDP ribazoletransferase [Methylomirabilota bacterium]